MKKFFWILLLSFIFIIPIYVNAEDNNKVEVYFNIPANITFKNEDLIIKEEVNCGEKLLEPSHVEIDGYIFKGWYNGDEKWDFANNIVKDDTTLIAKYIKKDSFSTKVTVDQNSNIKASIKNNIDISNYLEDVEENDNVNIILEISDASNIITEPEKQKFEEKISNNNLLLGQYIDLSLFMEINGNPSTRREIDETNNKVKIELTIPEKLRFNNRKYYLLRLHDNKVEIIYEGYPTRDWKLLFETNKFSLYAIAYSKIESNNINVPKTGDNIIIWISMLVVSLIGFISIVIFRKIIKLKQQKA